MSSILTRHQNDRLRVLYLVGKYPEFSETYMHEEMVSVSDEFDIKVVAYLASGTPRANHLPYHVVQYQDACINWGDFDLVNQSFTNAQQVQYLEEMGAVIENYRPDVIHGHYFATSL